MSAPSESRAIVWSVVNEQAVKYERPITAKRAQEEALALWVEALRNNNRVLNLHEIGVLMALIESGRVAQHLMILSWISAATWAEEERMATGYGLLGWFMLFPTVHMDHHHKGIAILKDALAHYPSKDGEHLLRILTFLIGEN